MIVSVLFDDRPRSAIAVMDGYSSLRRANTKRYPTSTTASLSNLSNPGTGHSSHSPLSTFNSPLHSNLSNGHSASSLSSRSLQPSPTSSLSVSSHSPGLAIHSHSSIGIMPTAHTSSSSIIPSAHGTQAAAAASLAASRETSRVAAKRHQLMQSVQSSTNSLQQEAMNVKQRYTSTQSSLINRGYIKIA
jgi:hypothetical protein